MNLIFFYYELINSFANNDVNKSCSIVLELFPIFLLFFYLFHFRLQEIQYMMTYICRKLVQIHIQINKSFSKIDLDMTITILKNMRQ